jgi:hypothetical protein
MESKIILYIVSNAEVCFFQNNFYLFLVWKDDPIELKILAFSPISHFQVRLPSGHLNLIIHIQDRFNCITEYYLPSMDVLSSSIERNHIPSFLTENQNTIEQIINSITQELNQMNCENIQQAISSKDLFITNLNNLFLLDGIPSTNIFISPLRYPSLQNVIILKQIFILVFLFLK